MASAPTEKSSKPVEASFATLDSLRELTEQTKDVEIDGVGLFRIRKVSVREFIEMKEISEANDSGSEWEATKLLLSTGVVEPPIGEDEDLLAALPISVTGQLTEQIAEFAGTDESFTGGSPTE